MLFYLAWCYVAVWFVIMVLCYFFHFKFRAKFVFCSFILFALSYGYIAYHIEPPFAWDLYRHFEELDKIREGGISYLFTDGVYGRQPGSAFLFYFISRLPNNHFLPMITIVIEYTITGYIVSDYYAQGKSDTSSISLFCLLHFGMNNIPWTVSSIRMPLAASLAGLAVYLDLIKNKKSGWLFYLAALSVHPGTIGVILIRMLLILQTHKIPVAWFALSWGIISLPIVFILRLMPVNFLRYIGDMIFTYTHYNLASSGDQRLVLTELLFLFFFVFISYMQITGKRQNKYYIFIKLFCFFTFSCLISEQMFLRYMMILSFLALPLISSFCCRDRKGSLYKCDVFILFFSTGLLAFQVVQLTSHDVSWWF